MSKVLVLENEWLHKEDLVNILIQDFKEQGHEIIIIENAVRQDRDEVIKAMASADILVFQTTWLRTHEVEPLGKLLVAMKPMEIYAISLCSHSIYHNLENTFDVETLAKLSKHKLFDVQQAHRSLRDENWAVEVDLKRYQKQLDDAEAKRQKLYKGLKPTGFKIRIKKLQAFGNAWANLKEGDIVDALDYSKHDPNKGRGVWVMGNGEPVKLLNSDGYDEFEYADNKCFALATDFYTRGNKADKASGIRLLAQYINGYLSRDIENGEKTLWDFCDEVCNLVGVERRGNRHYFETRLSAYLKDHKYFCEIDRTSRLFVDPKF
jgi:hypothetical protein